MIKLNLIDGFGYFILAALMVFALVKAAAWSLRRRAKSRLYNVKDFGAKGDGLTDDTEAIKAAMKAMADYGGLVFFPKGQYLYSDELSLRSISPEIQIKGESESELLDIEVELEDEYPDEVEYADEARTAQKPESD